jgi:hypothetical protein
MIRWEWKPDSEEPHWRRLRVWIPYHGWKGVARFSVARKAIYVSYTEIVGAFPRCDTAYSNGEHQGLRVPSMKNKGHYVYSALIEAARLLDCNYMYSDKKRSRGANHAWRVLQGKYQVQRMHSGRYRVKI